MRFKTDESYAIRHKILEYLFNNSEFEDDEIGSIKVAEMTGIPIKKIHTYHELLKKGGEITCCEEGGQHMMRLKESGRYAYLENKYLKEGRNDFIEYWFSIVKIVAPIVAIVISVFSLVIGIQSTNKVQKLEQKLEEVEKSISK